MNYKLGFMQGRLSKIVNGKIQAFPWKEWEFEFKKAAQIGINLMEWTLDHERLHENPLMTRIGRERITQLCHKNNIRIESLTGDCFMQEPFWKQKDLNIRNSLKENFIEVCNSASKLGIKYIIVPIVDNGKIEKEIEAEILINFLLEQKLFFSQKNLCILFESEQPSKELAELINNLPKNIFGINYDIGNSASLAYNPEEEIATYGDRIYNVHIKDRLKGGTTVPLGRGNADFQKVFQSLKNKDYQGNFILQAARASNGNHVQAIIDYKELVLKYLKNSMNLMYID